MKAKAVVFTGPNAVEFSEVQVPEPGDNDVVVEVDTSWISNGTEGSFLRGERIEGDKAYREGDPWPFPIVAGYQKVGTITHIGKSVEGKSVGDTVFCTVGHVEGMFQANGGQVSPSVCDASQVWNLPGEDKTGVPIEAYSGLILTQVGYNCGARPPVEIGGAAIVLGDGMVGQWAAQTLWWRGAHVLLLGHHEDRLTRFTGTGNRAGRHTINTGEAGAPDRIADFCDEYPIDVFVDTVGSISAINDHLKYMRRFGHVVSAGFYGTEDQLGLQALRDYEAGIDLVSGWQADRNAATLELVSRGILETLPLVTHRFPAEQAAAAWKMIEEKEDNVLGVLLDWKEQ